MKYFDTAFTTAAIVAAGTTWATAVTNPTTFDTLCVPTVGAAINQRIGRSIKVLKIRLRGTINVAPQALQSAADTSTKIRYMIVQDEQTNAAEMTGTQLMENAANSIASLNSFQNLDNFGRFRVLKDKTIVISNANLANDTGASGGLVQSGMKRTFKCTIVFREPVVIRFNATNGGTIADIVDNSLHFVIAADQIDYAPTVGYSCRVCYKE